MDILEGGGGCSTDLYLPSTKSTRNKIPESDQEIVCHSLPNVCGLHGTNMKPGRVYLLNHFIIDSSKQEI